MPDREKVIHAVETAFELWIDEYTGCSWFKEDEVRKAKEDALALLKENEPVDIEIEGGGSTWWYVCEECHGSVDRNDLFCRHCGRPFRKKKCDGCSDDCPKTGNFVCPNRKL